MISNAQELMKHEFNYDRAVRFNFDRDDHSLPVSEQELEEILLMLKGAFLPHRFSKIESGELYHLYGDLYEYHYDLTVEEN